jgi:hypothetical protein
MNFEIIVQEKINPEIAKYLSKIKIKILLIYWFTGIVLFIKKAAGINFSAAFYKIVSSPSNRLH